MAAVLSGPKCIKQIQAILELQWTSSLYIPLRYVLYWLHQQRQV